MARYVAPIGAVGLQSNHQGPSHHPGAFARANVAGLHIAFELLVARSCTSSISDMFTLADRCWKRGSALFGYRMSRPITSTLSLGHT